MGVGTPRHNEVIYRRRRMAALVGLLIAIALIIWGAVALRGGSEESGPVDPNETAVSSESTTAETTESSASESPSSSQQESESTEPSKSDEPKEATETTQTTQNAADAKNTCELQDLVITAGSNQASFPSGTQPELFMTVKNPTAADCEIDLKENILRFEVYNLASNARVWSDVDCNPAVETGNRVFPAGEERYFQATWSRTNSAPEQCDNREPVPAGAYYLHTVIGQNPSAAWTFNLT